MKRIRKFVGLAAIAAVLYPLCCCFADVVAAMKPADDSAHACCSKTPDGGAPKSTKDACGADECCPHKQGAIQTAQAVNVQIFVVVPQPVAAVRESFDFGDRAVFVSAQRAHGAQRPPGRHDPPVYLLTHSFLN